MIDELRYGFELDGAEAPWRVARVDLDEALSALTVAVVELACDVAHDPDDPLAWLDRRAALTLARGPRERRVAGVVTEVDDLGVTGDARRARVRVEPSLSRLAHRTDWRVYQDLDALGVVREVLTDAGLYAGARMDLRAVAHARLARRPYCVQWGERDLDFVARLLEDEGLAFAFGHDGLDDTLRLLDGAALAQLRADDGGDLAVLGHGVATHDVEALREARLVRATRPTATALRDFDFMAPDALAATTFAQGHGALARYHYPAGLTFADDALSSGGARRHDGPRRATVRAQLDAQGAQALRGEGNVSAMEPGVAFTCEAHPGRWLVTAVRHRGEAREALQSGGDLAGDEGDRYRNAFEAAPAERPWRPPRVTPRPVAGHPQTATVCAPPGVEEPVSVDAMGRVLVRFHWERPERRSESQRPQPASCWMRVVSPWAGAGFGVMFVPRVGMEVVVQCLDGDPDRPVVTGCVYNARNPPPLALPPHRARSTVHTRTLDDPAGHNELRFDDAPGAEEVFVRAQRDLTVQVLRNRAVDVADGDTVTVGADSTLTVGANRVETVRGERIATVMGGDAATVLGARRLAVDGLDERDVRGDAEHRVAGAMRVSVGGALEVTVGPDARDDDEPSDATLLVRGSQRLSADDEVVVTARRALVLQCGDSRVVLRPEGITVSGRTLVLAADDEATLRTDDAALTLSDDAELTADDVRLYSVGARMELTTEATLRGARVNLGPGTGRPVSLAKDPLEQAVFRFVQSRARTPLAGLAVRIRHPDGEVREHTTDADGYVRLEGADRSLFEVVGAAQAPHLDHTRARARRR